ncbi:MAG: chemotaxis protein CheW [Rhodospirillales bacterium]|nr:chemotaxis protein CheW [Rhodospirillales bacterium]MCW8952254.1 chemotaxis protein CheW [Rhodospirillales bacterium]MCW9039483.1 chemotaxis protein CheW [Rhodospirillales bacterium]
MGVTVEHKSDLYTFLVDSVGEVLNMKESDYEKTPGTLDPLWREFSCGVYRLDGRLMVVLDVEKMLTLSTN